MKHKWAIKKDGLYAEGDDENSTWSKDPSCAFLYNTRKQARDNSVFGERVVKVFISISEAPAIPKASKFDKYLLEEINNKKRVPFYKMSVEAQRILKQNYELVDNCSNSIYLGKMGWKKNTNHPQYWSMDYYRIPFSKHSQLKNI